MAVDWRKEAIGFVSKYVKWLPAKYRKEIFKKYCFDCGEEIQICICKRKGG